MIIKAAGAELIVLRWEANFSAAPKDLFFHMSKSSIYKSHNDSLFKIKQEKKHYLSKNIQYIPNKTYMNTQIIL